MIPLDALIYKLAFAGLIVACVRWQAFPAAFFLCLSFAINDYIFILNPESYEQLADLYFTYATKDYVIAVFLGIRHKTTEIILAIIFLASCLFHLLAQIEVYNYVLRLKSMRTDFMIYITAAQLATMYLIILNGSGSNGGKRVKHNQPGFNRHYDRFFYTKVYKD